MCQPFKENIPLEKKFVNRRKRISVRFLNSAYLLGIIGGYSTNGHGIRRPILSIIFGDEPQKWCYRYVGLRFSF
jgi:hypothetical protein